MRNTLFIRDGEAWQIRGIFTAGSHPTREFAAGQLKQYFDEFFNADLPVLVLLKLR